MRLFTMGDNRPRMKKYDAITRIIPIIKSITKFRPLIPPKSIKASIPIAISEKITFQMGIILFDKLVKKERIPLNKIRQYMIITKTPTIFLTMFRMDVGRMINLPVRKKITGSTNNGTRRADARLISISWSSCRPRLL